MVQLSNYHPITICGEYKNAKQAKLIECFKTKVALKDGYYEGADSRSFRHKEGFNRTRD